ERGQRNPTLHNVLKLAEVLGVDPGDLVHGLRSPREALHTWGPRYTASTCWNAGLSRSTSKRGQSRRLSFVSSPLLMSSGSIAIDSSALPSRIMRARLNRRGSPATCQFVTSARTDSGPRRWIRASQAFTWLV